MRILISAFACQPDMGSEPEAGLQAVLAAASRHEVWVVTRQYHIPYLDKFLATHELGDRIHTIGLDVDGVSRKMEKRIGLAGVHWHHDRWQKRLAQVAIELDAEVGFDIVHHATYAAYWTRTGAAAVSKPLVWGPIGGAVTAPWRLLPTMGLRGTIGDLLRSMMRPLVAKSVRAKRTAEGAAVVIVQNPETARTLGRTQDAILLPNALAATASVASVQTPLGGQDEELTLIAAGRLVGWKGTLLAIAAMKHVEHPNAVLRIYGDGPQRDRLERYVTRHKLSNRVKFQGQVARDVLLRAMGNASALVHPSLHEEAGFVVAEALALGTPVVCLDRGGPPVLTAAWPNVPSRVVRPSTAGKTARDIGAAVDNVAAAERGTEPTPPHPSYTQGLLEAYEKAVAKSDT